MTENQGQDLEVRAVARRRTVAVTAAAVMLVAVAVAGGLWAHSWAERGWLGFAFHGEMFEDPESVPDLWILQQESYQVAKVHPGSPAARAGISQRERVISIAGIAPDDAAALAELDARLRPGDRVSVELGRDDETRRVELTLESPLATSHTVVSALASLSIGLLFLVTGLVVYWARPTSRLALIFALLSASGAAFFFLLIFGETVIMSPRGLTPGADVWYGAGFWILVVLVSFLLTNLILHLALIFPRQRPIVERWPQIFHWLHGLPFAMLLAAGLLFAGAASSKLGIGWQVGLGTVGGAVAVAAAGRLWRARRHDGRGLLATVAAHPYTSLAVPLAVFLFIGLALDTMPKQTALVVFVVTFVGLCLATAFLYPLVYAVLTLLFMLRSYRDSGVEEKRQVRWPLWGLGVCLVGTLVTTVVCMVLPQIWPEILDSTLYHTLSSIFGRLFYAAIPVSFAFAIAKYRLMEVDLLVRKTVVYAATTTFIVGVYFVVVGLFGIFLVSWIDLDDPVVAVGTTLLVVACFVPVRNRLQQLVDRRFRRDGTDRREALESIRRGVLSAADLETLLPAIAETVQQALQSRAVVLFVQPPDRDELVARAKVGVPDEVIGRLRLPTAALAGAGRVTDRAALALDEETHGRLKRHRLHCVAPARRQGEVVGAVAAADSLSGDEPNADDREFLASVADQLALAVGTLGLRRESVELDEARLLQRSLLPSVLPQPPGTDLAGAWHPAREVAGDYYEAIDFGGGKLALCIGDVVGKGMAAALLMSSLQAAVRAVATADTTPARLCEQVRRVVTANLTGGRFVTFFYALYDAAERRLVYANAGHVPPLLVRADGAMERLETGGGAFVRLLGEAPFEDGETTLAAGDRLVMFTDGVSEAQSPDGELYGEERLGVLLSTNGDGASAAALAERITEDVRSHAAGDPADDLTLLLLRAT